MKQFFRNNRFFWSVLAVAFLLRLVVIFLFYFSSDYVVEDSHFYILVAHEPTRLIYMPNSSTLAITPLYPLFLLPFFNLIPDTLPFVQFVSARITQAGIDTLTVVVIYLITRHLFDVRAARVALLVQALDLRYAFTVGTLVTETLFIAVFSIFVLAYLKAAEQNTLGRYIGAGALLGIAILIRPIPLLLPAMLFIHAWFHPQNRRLALKGVAMLTLTVVLMMAPWSIRGWLLSGSLVPGSNTAFSHLWQSTRPNPDGIGGVALEEAALEDVADSSGTQHDGVAHITTLEYIQAAFNNILGTPSQWLSQTLDREARAYLQPYGTGLLSPPMEMSFLETIRAVATGRAPLSLLLTYPGFPRRVLMYLWHFWGLILGTLGILFAWRIHRWESFPLLGWILYGSALLSVLLVEPRYLFPLMFAFNIFAAYAAIRIWDALRLRYPHPLPLIGERR